MAYHCSRKRTHQWESHPIVKRRRMEREELTGSRPLQSTAKIPKISGAPDMQTILDSASEISCPCNAFLRWLSRQSFILNDKNAFEIVLDMMSRQLPHWLAIRRKAATPKHTTTTNIFLQQSILSQVEIGRNELCLAWDIFCQRNSHRFWQFVDTIRALIPPQSFSFWKKDEEHEHRHHLPLGSIPWQATDNPGAIVMNAEKKWRETWILEEIDAGVHRCLPITLLGLIIDSWLPPSGSAINP